jgi:pimeloyl-ACP methyl ester carboxylesterase
MGQVNRMRDVAGPFVSSALAVVLAAGLLRCGPAAAAESLHCGVAARNDRPAVVITRLAGVPAILRIPQVIAEAPIVLWHGFGPPAGERALMAALPLDEVPAVKVYLGLPLFGARSPPGGTDEMIRRQTQDVASLIFEPVVMGAARELSGVVRALQQRRCMAQGQKIGLFGFSAGGAAVLVALARRQPAVRAAVTLNASTGLNASIAAFERATRQPYTWTPRARLLARRSDAVLHAADIAAGDPPVALLLIQGADDETVSPSAAVRLHDALTPYYRRDRAESRLRLTVISRQSHAWAAPRADSRLEREIADWFNRYS